jgi:hypothetical protein
VTDLLIRCVEQPMVNVFFVVLRFLGTRGNAFVALFGLDGQRERVALVSVVVEDTRFG